MNDVCICCGAVIPEGSHVCPNCQVAVIRDEAGDAYAFLLKHMNLPKEVEPVKQDNRKATNKNPYWEKVCAIAKRQRSKGMATYGQGLEKNPAGIVARIEHLQEELVDALMYCEWIKDVVQKQEVDDGK